MRWDGADAFSAVLIRPAGLKLALALRSLPAVALAAGAPAEAALAAGDRALAAAAAAGGFAGGAAALVASYRSVLLAAEAQAAPRAAVRGGWGESDSGRIALVAGDAELTVRYSIYSIHVEFFGFCLLNYFLHDTL